MADIVATLYSSSFEFIGCDIFFKLFSTLSTANIIPFLISIGFIPEAIALHPLTKISLAKIVAVVVPSPDSLFDLLATYLTKEAPKFSYLHAKSIALATVTPSLVIFGSPKF